MNSRWSAWARSGSRCAGVRSARLRVAQESRSELTAVAVLSEPRCAQRAAQLLEQVVFAYACTAVSLSSAGLSALPHRRELASTLTAVHETCALPSAPSVTVIGTELKPLMRWPVTTTRGGTLFMS